MQKYQGDTGFLKIEKPDKELNWKKVSSGFIVAEGEVSGHHHKLVCEPRAKIEIAKDEHGWFLRKLDNELVSLQHDTHKTQTITERGIYFIPLQREYDEVVERRVAD